MRISEISLLPNGELWQLEGIVESDVDPDTAEWFAPFTLWYRFPKWSGPYLSRENGDPFLAALLPLAMQTGEPLTIAAPVSPRLLAALPDIQEIFAGFYSQLRPIAVRAVARQASLPSADAEPGVGLFFSLGVDSFYSLLKNVRDHPADARTVTHLISANGFDVTYEGDDGAFPPDLLRNFHRVAEVMGKTLLPVSTNIRRVGVRLTPWPMHHGAALASVALALGSLFRRVSIAASTTYDLLYPWGSHPVLDPLWSTETLTFVHDGCEANITAKAAMIAESNLVLETLRPCGGHGVGHGADYNCGRCEKCLRTMLDLLIAGKLGHCRTLPDDIDPELLRRILRPGGRAHMAEYGRRLAALEAIGASSLLCEVLREHLSHGMAPQFNERYGLAAARATPKRTLVERMLRCTRQ